MPPLFPKKTSLAIATLGALLLLLESVKLARPFTLAEMFDFRPRDLPVIEPLPPPLSLSARLERPSARSSNRI